MKILFVCTGNICRSAMAQKLMEKKAKDNNINVEIYSAGTYAEEGDYPTEEAIEVLKEYDVDLTGHRATSIENSNIEQMDVVLCSTTTHKLSLEKMYPNMKDKIYTLNEYVGEGLEIKDPWGSDIATYRLCAAQINKYLDKLVEKLKG